MYILKFPMPPSVNQSLMSVRGRLIKTNVARMFDGHVQKFKLLNHHKLETLNQILKQKIEEGYVIRVDTFFVFHSTRIIGKKYQVKTLDANNRIKAALDGLVKCLTDVDEKHF